MQNMLEVIKGYLDETDRKRFEEYKDYIWARLEKPSAKLKRIIEKESNQEVLCEKIYTWGFKANADDPFRLINVYAFDGDWDTLKYLIFYEHNYCRQDDENISSKEKYFQNVESELREENLYNKKADYRNRNHYVTLHVYHQVKRIRDEIVAPFIKKPKLSDSFKQLDPKSNSNDHIAFEQAFEFISCGAHEQAREMIELLKKYRTMPYRGASMGGFKKQLYDAMTDCLDYLLQAQLTEDPNEAKQLAAKAIVEQFRGLTENWKSEDADTFMADTLLLAQCIAVEFAFNEEWAKQCCRLCLSPMDNYFYHPSFARAMEWDAWFAMPEDLGLLPADRILEISDATRRKLMGQD